MEQLHETDVALWEWNFTITKNGDSMDLLIFALFIIGWFVMTRWVLPALGVPTWMNPDACRVPPRRESSSEKKIEDRESEKAN